MKRIFLILMVLYGYSFSQTCEGMFNVYDSCYDINNCDDGYNAMKSLINSVGLKSSEKLASICRSSCENKKAGIKKMSKDEFMAVVCPSKLEKEESKNANPPGNNK
ncbi:MAG: hypothetical protein ABWJ98_00590 [Hydrogenothermaceae bacterium]